MSELSITREHLEGIADHVETLEEELETLKYQKGNLQTYLYELGVDTDEIRDIKCGDLKWGDSNE